VALMAKVGWCAIMLTLVSSVHAPAQVQKKTAGKPAIKSTSNSTKELAWSDWGFIASILGVDEASFRETGLSKLSQDQLTTLVGRAAAAQEKAKAVLQPYLCGPTNAPKGRLQIFVKVSDTTAAEIASGIRDKLRAMSDLDLVYNEPQAQLALEVLGLKNELKSGYVSGYTISISIIRPCKAKMGQVEWPIELHEGHMIFTGDVLATVINTAVANVDTDNFENERKFNASIQK